MDKYSHLGMAEFPRTGNVENLESGNISSILCRNKASKYNGKIGRYFQSPILQSDDQFPVASYSIIDNWQARKVNILWRQKEGCLEAVIFTGNLARPKQTVSLFPDVVFQIKKTAGPVVLVRRSENNRELN